jgi:hypothetical protein
MMSRPLTRLILLVTCGALVLGAALAVAIEASAGAGARQGAAAAGRRNWPVNVSAAPGDLTLAEVSFHQPRHGRRISGSSLRLTVGAPFGDDYLAAATPRSPTSSVLRVLVLLVNRPSPLLDPVTVHLRLAAADALATPLVLRGANRLSQPAGAPAPALCNLAVHDAGLSAAGLRALGSRGQPLAGFDATGALAQAYDLTCGLPYASSFTQAVAGSSGSSSPNPPESTTSTPTPPVTPPPTPPVGKVPGEGCVPTPGYACPAAFESRSEAVVIAG